jgi:hypothetical protein
MVMNRLPAPSAVTAAMLPFSPSGTARPLANFAQSAGSNVTPCGSDCGASRRGSMPVGSTFVTVNSGPKLDVRSATRAMSPVVSAGSLEHAASSTTVIRASHVRNIAANLPAGGLRTA